MSDTGPIERESAESTSYRGPERRARNAWPIAAFDEIDFGIVLLSYGNGVMYANRAARLELSEAHPLTLVGNQVVPRDLRDQGRLDAAVRDAGARGLRRLVLLGEAPFRTPVAVVPLDSSRRNDNGVMLMLSRRESADPLAIEVFARGLGLTSAETRVLQALCNGKAPLQIAREASVEISTIRSQIISIRQKTGASNLRTLVAQVATLPPFMGILARALCGRTAYETQPSRVASG